MQRFFCFILSLLGTAQYALAQQDPRSITEILRSNLSILTSDYFQGRGYVNDGQELAAVFIQHRFVDMGLKPAPGTDTYVQGYTFPVNTFPGKMELSLNGKWLKPGDDYIIDAASASCYVKEDKVNKINLNHITDTVRLQQALDTLSETHVWYLDGVDSVCRLLNIRKHNFAARLPKGCFIIPESAKLTWTVSRTQNVATVFYVKKESLPHTLKTADAEVLAKLEPKVKSVNIIGEIPGKIKDTFLVCSAHYDHLGKMGTAALFPGASDNASGTSMLLYLASYYATHPQRYSMLFIAFSGEEAGLMGSQYFVAHPFVPLENIKFLTNIDIMGDATDGVTVVNATEYPNQFALLSQINDEHHYLPAIKSRGKAANSDHYYFSEAGVPAFFLYSNGGKGHYHDIFDTGDEVTFKNVEGVAHLLIDFISAIR